MRRGIVAAFAAFVLAGAAPAPRLIDQNGHAFTLASLRGVPLVVTFVAARCTEACPLVNGRFARAQDVFREERVDARLLTITLDPKHDTPATMREMAARFGADPRRWLLASGSVRDVTQIMNAFGVVARGGRDAVPDEHTTFVYVFDKHGVLRERIFASTVLEEQLARDLQMIAKR